MRKVILIDELMKYLSNELERANALDMTDKSPDYIEGYTAALEFLLSKVRNRW